MTPRIGPDRPLFRIGDDVYRPVLRDSVRTFYYQRSGTPIPARYGGNWHHGGGHLGRHQDRSPVQPGRQGTRPSARAARAAGSTRGTSTSTSLTWNPPSSTCSGPMNSIRCVFGDDTNIPESGNGVPDLLDEVKWELDWLLKMQDTDGGVFNRVAGRSHDNGPDPPNSDTQPRFYTAKTTWATATAAASYAHARAGLRSLRSHLPRLRRSPSRRLASGLGLPRGTPQDGAGRRYGRRLRPWRRPRPAATPTADAGRGVHAAAQLFKTTGEPAFQGVRSPLGTRRRPRPPDNGLHPLRDGHRLTRCNHPALTQALFIYATTPGASRPSRGRSGRPWPARRRHPRGHRRPRRPLPGLSLRGALLLGQQPGQGPLGPRPADGHGARPEPRAASGLPEIMAGDLHFIHGAIRCRSVS